MNNAPKKESPYNSNPFRFSDQHKAILVLIPSIIALAVFVYGFITWTAVTSLYDAKLSTGMGEFKGLENYVDLFVGLRYERFRTDMINAVFFTVLFIGVPGPGAAAGHPA